MAKPKKVEDTKVPHGAVYDPQKEQITCPDGSIIPYKRQADNKKTDSNEMKSVNPKPMRGDDPVCEVVVLSATSLGSMGVLMFNDGNYGVDMTYPVMGGPWALAFNSNGRVWVNLGGL